MSNIEGNSLHIFEKQQITQGIIMTEMISILLAQGEKRRKITKCNEQLQKVFMKHFIKDFQLSERSATFWFSSNLFQQTQWEAQTDLKYSIIGSLSYGEHLLSISLSLLDEDNKIVKGSNIYQKNSLMRLSFLLNSYSDFFQIKVNPMTGQLTFSHTFFYQALDVPLIFNQTLQSLKTQHNLFFLVFQFLQKIPKSKSQYLRSIDQKIGIQKDNDLEEQSTDQMDQEYNSSLPSHVEYFMTDKRSFSQFLPPPSFIQQTLYNKEIVGARLAKNPNDITKTNLNVKTVLVPLNFKHLKNEKQENITDADALRMTILTKNSEPLKIKVLMDSTDRVFNEYLKCEKVARKFYLTFLKEYLILKGQQNSKDFIFYVCEETVKMRSFLQKNFLTMSAATRVKISFDMALMLMICNEAFKGFSVKIEIDNLLITRNLTLKLDRLCMNSSKMDEDTSKVIMRVLFGSNIAIMSRSSKKKEFFTEFIDSLSMIGPSPMSTLIKKTLLDMLEKKFVKPEGGNRENLLMALQIVNEFYQKDHDIKESWESRRTMF